MTSETPPGAPPPGQTINIQAPYAQPANGLAVASLVLGVIAVFTFWIPFLGWIPALLGLVLGLVGLQQAHGRGMAVAGVVCSGLALVVKVWFWVVLLGIFGAAASHAAMHV
ncbi:MAG TPA: hypothetical protein VMU93_01650 [Caulobacteraceae bacterium]|nr:hypothetical protein [Caulobacteraceae bacterium]